MVVERLRTIRRAGRQRGAAILVVMLVFAALSALGLFAVRSASLTDLAAGYDREMTQTHFIGDYAVYALAADIAIDPTKHAALMEKKPPANYECVGYVNEFNAGLKPTCARYELSDLELPVTARNSSARLIDQSNAVCAQTYANCSLGPSPLQAGMKIELTDKHPAWPPVAGNQASSSPGGGAMLGYVMVTISAEGMVRPPQATAGSWDTASATSAGIEQSRAYVRMGPIPLH